MLQTSSIAAIRRALAAWYGRNKRDLPWRRSRDPYHVWVSEIMLQQTRVAAAQPYYETFLKRFPTIGILANSPEHEVLTAWAGLGYYSRARNLHKAARLLRDQDAFPRHYEGIRALPGIGDYTAAAIASIAFDLPYAAVDGNVLRVLSRVTAEPGDITTPAIRKRLGECAGALLDRKRPGDFNEALMELGATICMPKSPECGACPIAGECASRSAGRQNEFPVRLNSAVRKRVHQTLCYIERDGEVLCWQRPPQSRRMAGFWELPTPELLGQPRLEKKAGDFRHTIVNTTYCFSVVRASVKAVPGTMRWLPKKDLDEVPLSTTAKKALRCLAKRAG